MAISISIEGIDGVIDALNRIVSDDKLSKGIEKACMIVEGEAKANAPVDTGRLRSSIMHQVDGARSGEVGTNVEYAIYQEFGTYKMKAHPFLVPALKSKQSDVIAAIAEQFRG